MAPVPIGMTLERGCMLRGCMLMYKRLRPWSIQGLVHL